MIIPKFTLLSSVLQKKRISRVTKKSKIGFKKKGKFQHL